MKIYLKYSQQPMKNITTKKSLTKMLKFLLCLNLHNQYLQLNLLKATVTNNTTTKRSPQLRKQKLHNQIKAP